MGTYVWESLVCILFDRMVIQKITQNVSPGKLLMLSGMLGIQRFTIFTMFGFKIQDPSDSAMEQAQAMTGGAGG